MPNSKELFYVVTPGSESGKALKLKGQSRGSHVAKAVPTEVFQTTLTQVTDMLDDSFTKLETKKFGGLGLDEVEVHLEVTGDGQVGILGNSASLSGTASLTLTFKRSR